MLTRTLLLRFLVCGCLVYAKNRTKDIAKVVIGREPYRNARDRYFELYFSLYLRGLLGLRSLNRFTCISHPTEGAGSQALMIMHAINLSRTYGLRYLHTSFREIAHADRPMPEWVDAWEAHFNLGMGEILADEHARDIINYNLIESFDLALGLAAPPRLSAATISEIRRKYYSNKSPHKKEVLTVCVHIRRGDVTPDMHPDLWSSTASMASTIATVKSILDSHDVKHRVCIFSQKPFSDFAELNVPDAEMFLDVDPTWSMQETIEADVLIMSKSCLSVVAAIIGDGIKLSQPSYPFFEHPLDEWLICAPNGEFDRLSFERQLKVHIASRQALARHQAST